MDYSRLFHPAPIAGVSLNLSGHVKVVAESMQTLVLLVSTAEAKRLS
jgi:hypothetical protein